MNSSQKGQGAIEYLLIIAAAILVVAVVIIAVTSVLGNGEGQIGIAKGTQQNSMSQLEIELALGKGYIQIADSSDIPAIGEWGDEKTYFLSNDLSSLDDSINLTGTTGVTLDCMGRHIATDNSNVVVSAANTTNLTLKNCIIEKQANGFTFSTPTSMTLENIIYRDNESGARFNNGGTVTIKNSEFCSNNNFDLTNNGAILNVTVINSKADNIGRGITIDSGAFESCT